MRRIRSPVRSPAHTSEIQGRHQDRSSREERSRSAPREESKQSAPTSESTPSSVRRRRPNIFELAYNFT